MLLGLPLTNSGRIPARPGLIDYPSLSLLDISAFLLALFPVLLRTHSTLTLLSCASSTIFFVILSLPVSLALTWCGVTRSAYPFPASEQPSLLQDIVIRLVRHAFTHFPHTIGRAFFSEPASVALFSRRLGGPRAFRDRCVRVESATGVVGWWITPEGAHELGNGHTEEDAKPDLVLMYLHGGGLTMGSPAFYIQFLLLVTLELRARGYRRPAVFAPVYGLAPETQYQEQLAAVVRSWKYVLMNTGQNTVVGVGGDSAGGGLAHSMLFSLSEDHQDARRPDFLSVISPWTSLIHPPSCDVPEISSDYIAPPALAHFAHLASGAQPLARSPGLWSYLSTPPLLPYPFSSATPPATFDSPVVVERHRALCAASPLLSPGDITEPDAWARALTGVRSAYVAYGTGEVLAPQARALLEHLRGVAAERDAQEPKLRVVERAWPFVHAAPVVYAFLGRNERQRSQGVEDLARFVAGEDSRTP